MVSRSLRTWFPAVSPDLHSISPLRLNKYLGYFIPVSSSESALGFPCSTTRALLEQHDQALKTLLEHIKEFSQSLSDLQGRPCAQSSQPVPILPARTLVPVSSPTSRHPATLFWIPHSITPLDSPPDLLTLSQPPSLQPQPPHLVSSSFP
ncbi:unnamed protein product [Coregonus sp. 'balchen']|nr:unnamed protein product [Coregonus sp. 'balchen']